MEVKGKLMCFANPKGVAALTGWYRLLGINVPLFLGALSYGFVCVMHKLKLERRGLPGSDPVYGEHTDALTAAALAATAVAPTLAATLAATTLATMTHDCRPLRVSR